NLAFGASAVTPGDRGTPRGHVTVMVIRHWSPGVPSAIAALNTTVVAPASTAWYTPTMVAGPPSSVGSSRRTADTATEVPDWSAFQAKPLPGSSSTWSSNDWPTVAWISRSA